MDAVIPKHGRWPVDPQDAQQIEDERLWIDGCFDFFHHGHAGVMLQARQLGKELYVGIHSDEDILEHKGPTVMTLKERVSAADACRWSTKSVPHAPYVTSLDWVSHYGCRYVVHGDDITSDSSGEDCYRYVKQAGRFKVVKRTPGISTTDLVGRMLLCTKDHFIKSMKDVLDGKEGKETDAERAAHATELDRLMRAYSTDESGLSPGVDVYTYRYGSISAGVFESFVKGKKPKPGQRLVYVDGGFDLFSSGHIEFLRSVIRTEDEKAISRGWYESAAISGRIDATGEDYGPCYVVAGIHDDAEINKHKDLNYPIMNIFERGLCLLQCRYVHSVIFGAPFKPTEPFLRNLPTQLPQHPEDHLPCVLYHGPTSFMELGYDPYEEAKKLGIFEEIPRHEFQEVDAGHIVDRITRSRARFEERQRAKGVKAVGEEAARLQEAETRR